MNKTANHNISTSTYGFLNSTYVSTNPS